MARLPIPGEDTGVWGTVLNNYLRVAHTDEGGLKPIAQSTITGLAESFEAKYTKPPGGIPVEDLQASMQTALNKAATSVQKSELIVNARDYGAKGDGTTDDTTALQTAITAAEGKTLLLPRGTYVISSALRVGGGYPGGITITGAGWDSVIKIANGAGCWAFTLEGIYTPGLHIRDLFIDGNGHNQTAGGGIDADGAVWCQFTRLYINRPWQAGIFLHNDGTGGYGHHNVIESCRIEQGSYSNGGAGHAILLDRSDENRVVNCSITDCGNTAAASNHMIYDKAGLQIFQGNTFVGGAPGATCLELQGANNVVTGNIFDGGNNSDQLRLNGGLNLITGNRFYNIGFAASGSAPRTGIFIDNVPNNIIAGNIFSPINAGQGFADSAIHIDFSATRNRIMSNSFLLDGSTGVWQTAAVNLSGAGPDNVISDNSGYNPPASQTPSVPTSGQALTNPFVTHQHIYLTAGGGACSVSIGGTAVATIPSASVGSFRVDANQTITLTYSSPPSWVWISE